MNKIHFIQSSTKKVHVSTEDGWTWCAYHLKSYKKLDTFEDAPSVILCKFCFDWLGHFVKFSDSLTKRAADEEKCTCPNYPDETDWMCGKHIHIISLRR